jgi:hypothetical protein
MIFLHVLYQGLEAGIRLSGWKKNTLLHPETLIENHTTKSPDLPYYLLLKLVIPSLYSVLYHNLSLVTMLKRSRGRAPDRPESSGRSEGSQKRKVGIYFSFRGIPSLSETFPSHTEA